MDTCVHTTTAHDNGREYVQLKLSNQDTLGTKKSVLIREVSLFQG